MEARPSLTSVELFAGAGGLALGASMAGFGHRAVVELDHEACETIRANQQRGLPHLAQWPLIEADVRAVSYHTFGDDIDLLAGGVPCQPWSLGGKHRGMEDERNLFPDMVRAVRALRPRAILIENVKGLLRPSFANYFQYIRLMLAFPEVERKPREEWTAHLSRLEKHATSGSQFGLRYHVVHELLNAADYGVPQRRERVFLVAFRSDLGVQWSFPAPTHSDAALRASLRDESYWDEHRVTKKLRPRLAASAVDRCPLARWRTVRDALAGLPDPECKAAARFANHQFQPGARAYPGHTGSPLDEPAKTLKAGDHGVPGGENSILFPDGRLRYMTVRESARIQTFPDEFVFPGSWSRNMRQLGNAVPARLACVVAGAIARQLSAVRSASITP